MVGPPDWHFDGGGPNTLSTNMVGLIIMLGPRIPLWVAIESGPAPDPSVSTCSCPVRDRVLVCTVDMWL